MTGRVRSTGVAIRTFSPDGTGRIEECVVDLLGRAVVTDVGQLAD
jgi:hypothetical protein